MVAELRAAEGVAPAADVAAIGPSLRVVRWAVVGLLLAAAATVGVWERVRAGEEIEMDRALYAVAAARAPWLAGMYGTWGQAAESEGNFGMARACYDQVLTLLPGHPGTALARARLLLRSGAPLGAAECAAIGGDLAVAARGIRYQALLLSGDDAGPAPATAALLRELADLERELVVRLEAGAGAGGS